MKSSNNIENVENKKPANNNKKIERSSFIDKVSKSFFWLKLKLVLIFSSFLFEKVSCENLIDMPVS